MGNREFKNVQGIVAIGPNGRYSEQLDSLHFIEHSAYTEALAQADKLADWLEDYWGKTADIQV